MVDFGSLVENRLTNIISECREGNSCAFDVQPLLILPFSFRPVTSFVTSRDLVECMTVATLSSMREVSS